MWVGVDYIGNLRRKMQKNDILTWRLRVISLLTTRVQIPMLMLKHKTFLRNIISQGQNGKTKV